MIAVAARWQLKDPDERQRFLWACGLCSGAAGLSVAANFAFTILDAFTLALVFALAVCRVRSAARGDRIRRYAEIAAAAVLPGAVITLFSAPSQMMLNWPKGQLGVWSKLAARNFSDGDRGVALPAQFADGRSAAADALRSVQPFDPRRRFFDGAAAVVVMSEEAADRLGLHPIAVVEAAGMAAGVFVAAGRSRARRSRPR